nr:RNA-directed DNA polymerase, eukaryota [Tanacetum cinerariifolium]
MFLLDYNRFQTLQSYNGIFHGVDGPPVMPEDPYAYVVAAFHALPSPDYVLGLEYPPSPEFVPEPVYTEFMPAEDDILPAEKHLLPASASPSIESHHDEDPEKDPVDYPADGGDEGNDDEDDDIDIQGDEEEDEYLAPANSTAVALPAIDHAPSAEETEPFETTVAEREKIPEADLPLRKRLCTAYTGTYELGESSTAAAARLREPVRDDLYRSHPGDYIDHRGGDDQALQRARVNRLFKDRRYHAHTARLMEGEARASRTAWTQSIDASDAAHSGVISLRTQVSAQRNGSTDLRASDRRFQTTIATQQEKIRELRAAHRRLQAQFIQKMAPKRTTKANAATTTTTTTTSVADAQLKALFEQGVAKALAARDTDRNTNDDDIHVSGTCARRTKRVTRVLKKMESIRNKIFNGADLEDNKMTWIAWDKVLASKERGGLGVSTYHALNRALILKWGEVLFKDAFLRLFALETDKNIRVADKLVAGVVSSFHRPVRGGSEQQLWLDLASILATVSLSLVGDRWTCNLSSDGSFRVRDVRNYIDAIFIPSSSEVTRWVKSVPIKINIFACRARRDCLPTRANLIHRGVNVDSVLCSIFC